MAEFFASFCPVHLLVLGMERTMPWDKREIMGDRHISLLVIDVDHSAEDRLNENTFECEMHGDGVEVTTPGNVAVIAHAPDVTGTGSTIGRDLKERFSLSNRSSGVSLREV